MILAIRKIYRVGGRPTIWKLITISSRADDYPAAVGKRLEIGFGNTGEPSLVAAFDAVRLETTESTPEK